MQTNSGSGRIALMATVLIMIVLAAWIGCRNDANDLVVGTTADPASLAKLANGGRLSVSSFNLVANLSGYSPKRIDENLLNAWGMAVNPAGKIWISANHAGLSVVYDTGGNAVRGPVTIPAHDSSAAGAPTGVVFNPTSAFVISATGEASKFIFASEDGVLSAWSSGSTALIVVDRSSLGTVYKGLALAMHGGKYFLYATDFHNGKVDVFDDHFVYDSTVQFIDPSIPAGFAPFNIQNFDGDLYVTYAKQKGPDNMDDQSGLGNGYVDVYNSSGMLKTRFASGGMLNSPWGLAKVTENGAGVFEHTILVGNFGDGHVNVFSKNGKFVGQLTDSKKQPVVIAGLWALAFIGNSETDQYTGHHDGEDHDGDDHDGDDHDGHDKNKDKKTRFTEDHGEHGEHGHSARLFFTAGPNSEADGVFGYISFPR